MKTRKVLTGTAYYETCNLENGEAAKALATDRNIHLEILYPKDMPLPDDAIARILDQDNLGLDTHGRRHLLDELKFTPPRVATCVHGFDCDDESEAKNVVIGRRLDDRLLRRLLALLDVGSDDNLAGTSPPAAGLDDEELARIQLGTDGGRYCD